MGYQFNPSTKDTNKIIVSRINNSKVFILALEQCICSVEGEEVQRKRKLSYAAAATPEPKEQKNKTKQLL